MTDRSTLLVLGYGNPSLGDDALGPELLARLERERARRPDWAGIGLLTDFQLQIEHALDLEDRGLVLFIDASVSCAAPFAFSPVAPERDTSYTTHALSPAAVLRVWVDLKGTLPPPAFLLTVRGYSFELGDRLSEQARANLEAAFTFARDLCERLDAQEWAARATPGPAAWDPLERKVEGAAATPADAP
jgi:hydrogenase maturation protease